jgi:hypothetical protein
VTLKLTFLGSTTLARRYRHCNGIIQWVPRSVCPKNFKHGDKAGDLHEVTIEDWWLKANPFEKPASKGQQNLL